MEDKKEFEVPLKDLPDDIYHFGDFPRITVRRAVYLWCCQNGIRFKNNGNGLIFECEEDFVALKLRWT